MKVQKIALFTLIFFASHAQAVMVCSKSLDSAPSTNNLCKEVKASYIFAPGILESERYAANYCPRYLASTGELISRPGSMNILTWPTACNFPEVALRKKSNNASTKELSLISQILSYIQNRNRSQKDTFLQTKFVKNHENSAYSDFSVKEIDLDITKVHFGQEADITTLEKTYTAHLQKNSKGPVVLHGFSRGAATTLNFLSTNYKQQPVHHQRVHACILEACYEKIPAAPMPVPEWMFRWIFPGYKPESIWPKNVVEHFPKNIPVLLVTSKGDTRVPAEHSWNLYKALQKADHPYVHILELEDASHPGYTYDNAQDKEKYETTVHAFYKKYGLPHDEDLAARGAEWFAGTQP